MKAILLSMLMVFFSQSSLWQEGRGIGDEAIGFSLQNVDESEVSLSDYADQNGVILVFTCNTCPYSVMYEQRIIDLHNQFADKGFPVVAIQPNDPIKSPGDSFSKMQQLAEEKNYPFPYLMDATQEVTKAYGATNTPHVYVLEKEEESFYIRYIGAIDNNSRDAKSASSHYVAKAVNEILSGEKVSQTSTKAIGCTIKWRE